MRTPARLFTSLVLVLLTACGSPPPADPRPSLRLSPMRMGKQAQALLDRDTTTSVELTRPLQLNVAFESEVQLRAVKTFGARNVEVEVVDEAVSFEPDSEAAHWQEEVLSRPLATRSLTLLLKPTGQGARLSELELWGTGRALAPRDPKHLALASRNVEQLPFENARMLRGEPRELLLAPEGSAEGRSCGQLTVATGGVYLADVRRAFVVYEATGILRAFELQRSVGNGMPTSGKWLGADSGVARTVWDEVDPSLLSTNTPVSLCLPMTATHPVTVKAPRLVLLLEDGRTLLDGSSQALLAEAYDTDGATAAALPDGSITLALARPTEVSGAVLALARPASVSMATRGQLSEDWRELGERTLEPGHHEVVGLGTTLADLKLSLAQQNPAEPALAELELVGSPVGPRRAVPRLVLSYPSTRLTADGELAERFGDHAFISGWAESPAGPGSVEVDGVRVSDLQGYFGEALTRPVGASGPWVAEVVARFPDGSTLRRIVRFEDDHLEELTGGSAVDPAGQVDADTRFGAEDQTSWGRAEPGSAGSVKLGTDVELEIPAGAVATTTSLGITRKNEGAVPPLDPGMINVTSPHHGGYRFGPRGMKFQKAVRVRLPFDERLLPEGMSAGQIQTFYFNEVADKWLPLKRVEVAYARKQIVSETDHFTFMINAVLVLPEHPGPVSFDPTSIKNLPVAEPREGIDFIASPEASGTGTARLSMPLRLPTARGAYQPPLSLSYDSSSANGYLGVGWELSGSSVAVDTRPGVPFYNGEERYQLDGDTLVPVALSDNCVDGSQGRRYVPRVEKDFRRILRCGADPTSYRFEVTDKSGTLAIYGASAAARLTSYKPGAPNIAQWFLERVIDANGNLTQYSYLTDKKAPGAQGEDFRWLYLSGVRYSGTAERTGMGALSGGVPGVYRVDFLPESTPSAGNTVREDAISSGRFGFKTLLRYRLGRIRVYAELPGGHTLVREYRLTYKPGDFSKSLLERIQLWGVGGVASGTLFHEHELGYTSTSETHNPFGTATRAWSFVTHSGAQSSDARAMSSSEEFSVSAHAYVGIGPTPVKEGGSVGVRLGFTHREGETKASLLDVNGDSLPDRLTRSSLALNGGRRSPVMSPSAPWGDPYTGVPLFGVGGTNGPKGLGKDKGNSFNIAAQATYGSFSANLGYTFTQSSAHEFLMDADGDGLVDYVGPGEVLFNQSRSTTCTDPMLCCPAGQFCFRPDPGVPTVGALANTGDLISGSDVDKMKSEVEKGFHPTDATFEWTAPFDGVVDVSGTLAWATPHTTPNAQRDGARLRIYTEAETPLLEVNKAYSDNASTAVSLKSVTVAAGQRLYFILSTKQDFPVDTHPGQQPVPVEELSFAPTVRYTSCGGACGGLFSGAELLRDATGARLFVFDAQEDFKLAGDPRSAVMVPNKGKVRIRWELDKLRATADGLRLCLQKYPITTDKMEDRPCSSSDLMGRTVAWNDVFNDQVLTLDLAANAGDQLIFRIESDLAFDPAAVVSSIRGEMIEVCSGTTCAPPSASFPIPAFDADPYVALHGRVEHKPLRPFVVPRDGRLVVRSSNVLGVSGLPADPAYGTVYFSGRTASRQLFKYTQGHLAKEVRVDVTQGEQILFEAHAERFWTGNWALQVGMEKSGAGDEGIEWFDTGAVPRHSTWDRQGDTTLASVLPGTSPFGGGFHGWRYGVTGFRDGEKFDSTIFYKKPSPPEGTDEEKLNEGLDRLEDEESDERKIARLYAPLVPRRLGTHMGVSLGLKPNTPAFVSADGNTFITPTTAHGAHKGGFAQGADGGGSVASALDVSQMMRSSIGHTVSGGLSLSVVSATLSGGFTHQKLDVMDMNGDGIIDVVTPGASRLTHLRTMGLRTEVPVPGGEALRNNVELSASVGLGISDAIRKLTPGGQTRGMAGMFPSIGGGIGVNLSATGNDLVDVNGDGLPDQVRRAGDAFRVRLNLGTSFAAEEDDLVVGYWGETGVFDPFVKDVQDSGVLGGSSEDRAKTGESRQLMQGAAQLLGSSDVISRSTSVTLEGNAGVMLNESFGVSANWETSLGATGVALVDVTGDGLPDYVRKSSRDGQLRVKVNRGYGFEAQERTWNLPAWPAGAAPAFMLPSPFDKVPGSSAVTGLLSKVLGPHKADTVEATGSHSALPSVGFVVTVPIPLSPFMTPWLHLSGGADVSPKKVSGFELGFADLNGDGLADHVLKTQQGDSSEARSEAIYARVNELGGGNLLNQVKRPLRGTISLEYVLTDNTVDLPEARYALSKVMLHDGRGTGTGHVLTTQYQYEGGRYDRDEKEFLGFRTVRELHADGSQRTLTFRNDTYEHRGLLEREEFRDAGGKLYTAMVNTYGTPELNPGAVQAGCQAYTPFYLAPERYCGSVFIPLKRTERRFYEGATADVGSPGLVSAREFQYDGYGNVKVFEELADPLDPSDDLHATVTYLDSPAAQKLYLKDRAETIVVRAGRVSSPGALLRKRVAGYDVRGNLTQLTSSIDGSGSATSNLEWYDNGTLLRVTGPRNKNGQRYAISYQYDGVTRTFLTHTQDSFGYESSGVPDLRFGGYVSNTDLNGNVVEREVDAFGRLIGVKGPYEAGTGAWATRIEYLHDASPARAVTRNFMVDGHGGISPVSTVVAQDGLVRVIQTKRTVEVFGQGVGMSVSGALEFDALGRLVQQGQATFSSAVDASFVSAPMVHPNGYAYDVLGRVVRETEPDGSQTQMSFDLAVPEGFGFKKFRKRTVDAESNVRAVYTDVLGQQVAEEEHIDGRVLTTRYHFNPSGDLERIVDALGNTTAFTYDMLGQRLTQSMPDTGLTEFSYDPAGNIIRKVTPNLRAAHTAIEYDFEYNRLARVDHPFTADIVYTYGGTSAGNNGRNRVIHVQDEAGTEELSYGKLGEVIRSKRVVNPLKPGDRPRTLETRFTFDTFGRMTEMVYPDGERLHYEFDAGGLLKRAVGHRPGEDEVYLKSIGYKLFGQKAHVELGNGVISHYQYDPVTLQLSFARTNKPGRTLQALAYQYDKVGNVVSMDNLIGPPSADESGETRYAFKYDDLYRLVEARGTALARAHRVDRFLSSWEYSDIHNMKRSVLKREFVRSISTSPEFDHPLRDDRDEAYVYDPAHPHQATKIGDATFMYDANGNTLAECRAFPGEVCDATVPPSNGGEGDVSRRSLKRYQWTEENWLSAVVENGQNATRFVYDSGGNRIAKLGRGGPSVTVGQFFAVKGRGHATKHIFAGSERVATKLLSVPDGFVGLENVPDGAPSDEPIPNGCVPSHYEPNKCDGLGTADPVVIDGPEKLKPATFYYHANHLGSTQWVTDAQAKVHEHVEYYPYGEVWRSPRSDSDGSPTHHQAFLFTSKEFDEETGLTYFGARYYDARHARWISPDPAWSIQGAPGLNVYHYVAWNPTNRVDPNGQWLESAWDVASFSMGVYSISQWDKNTSTWSKVLDVGGLVVDGAAIILPVVPGGAGAALKVARAGSKVDDMVDVARGTEKGVEAANHFRQAEKATEVVQATENAANAVKKVEQTAEAANATKKTEQVADATKSATDKRVKLRKKTHEEIEARQPRNDKGEMIDPNTQQPLKPGEIDVGHKPGQEWRKRKKMHEEKGSTRKEVLDAENDPDLYHLEDRSSNRSHQHEQKD